MPSTHPPHRRRSQFPDYYGLLGLPEDASGREIEAAYWKRAYSRDGREELALLNQAYEVLGNKERRAAYDEQRRAEGVAP